MSEAPKKIELPVGVADFGLSEVAKILRLSKREVLSLAAEGNLTFSYRDATAQVCYLCASTMCNFRDAYEDGKKTVSIVEAYLSIEGARQPVVPAEQPEDEGEGEELEPHPDHRIAIDDIRFRKLFVMREELVRFVSSAGNVETLDSPSIEDAILEPAVETAIEKQNRYAPRNPLTRLLFRVLNDEYKQRKGRFPPYKELIDLALDADAADDEKTIQRVDRANEIVFWFDADCNLQKSDFKNVAKRVTKMRKCIKEKFP